MEDFGDDSVDMIEMLMEPEKIFGIEIPDSDLQRLGRFGYTVNHLAGKLGL